MPDFPYTMNTGNLKKYLDGIADLGEPVKITNDYLRSINFKSSNDRGIVKILKHIGFINSDGSPTNLYRQFRNKETASKVMAGALKQAYKELFSTFSNACEKDDEALANFMRPYTKYSNETLGYAVRTFKVLCSSADFKGNIDLPSQPEEKSKNSDPVKIVERSVPSGMMSINLNIQLVLPQNGDTDTYDKIFASLKKHILDK